MTKLRSLVRIGLVALFPVIALAHGLAVFAATSQSDLILLLDNSGSMKKNDPDFLTKKAVTEFLQNLAGDARVAVLIFDEQTQLLTPLTPVSSNTQASLEKLNYRGRFTNTAAGLERAIYELKTNGRTEAEKFIILLTDGIIDTGNRTRDAELSRWIREDLASEAANAGIRIYGIALTEAADFQLIQTLAHKADGAYFRAFKADDLRAAFTQIDESIAKILSAPEPTITPADEQPAEPATPPAAEPPVSAPVTAEPEPEAAPQTATPSAAEPAASPPTTPQPAETPTTAIEPSAPSPVQAEPEPAATPDTMSGEDTAWLRDTRLIGIISGGLIVLGALGAVVFIFMKRSKREPGTSTQTLVLGSAKTPTLTLLKDLSGITGQTSHDITAKRTEIGRVAGNDMANIKALVINDTTISRQHALIEYRDGYYWICDRGSANGTFVNDERLTGERLLKHGDRVRFHKFEFEFVMPPIGDMPETVFMPSAFTEQQRPLSADTGAHDAAAAAISKPDLKPLHTGDEQTNSPLEDKESAPSSPASKDK